MIHYRIDYFKSLFQRLDEHLATPAHEVANQLKRIKKECESYGITIDNKTCNELKKELQTKRRENK